jgi:hypothetical protein
MYLYYKNKQYRFLTTHIVLYDKIIHEITLNNDFNLIYLNMNKEKIHFFINDLSINIT